MVGYCPDTTSCSPIALILWTLLGLPLLSFFDFFPFPSVTLRDSVMNPRVFMFLSWMIAFYRRDTCCRGICIGSLSEQAASILSRSSSPISMSLEITSPIPESFWVSSGRLCGRGSGVVFLEPWKYFGVEILSVPCVSLSLSSYCFPGFLSFIASICASAESFSWSSWRVSNRFWVCTLLWTYGPEIFLYFLFLFWILVNPSTSWISWSFFPPGLLFWGQYLNRCPCSWHLLQRNGICS